MGARRNKHEIGVCLSVVLKYLGKGVVWSGRCTCIREPYSSTFTDGVACLRKPNYPEASLLYLFHLSLLCIAAEFAYSEQNQTSGYK